MKKFPLYFFLLVLFSLICFILFYCREPVKFNTVIVPGKFSIDIPQYLIKTDSIDSSAVLQFENEKAQIFLLVYELEDTTGSSLEKNFQTLTDDLISKIDCGNLLKYFPVKINNHPAFIGNIRGTVKETDVYYRVVLIENLDKFYELILGVADNKRNGYDDDMNSLITSFSFFLSNQNTH